MSIVPLIARVLCWWFAIGCSLGLLWVIACLITRLVLRLAPADALRHSLGIDLALNAQPHVSSPAPLHLATAPLPRRLGPQPRLVRRTAERSLVIAVRHSA